VSRRQLDLAIVQKLLETCELDFDNPPHFALLQPVEQDNFMDGGVEIDGQYLAAKTILWAAGVAASSAKMVGRT